MGKHRKDNRKKRKRKNKKKARVVLPNMASLQQAIEPEMSGNPVIASDGTSPSLKDRAWSWFTEESAEQGEPKSELATAATLQGVLTAVVAGLIAYVQQQPIPSGRVVFWYCVLSAYPLISLLLLLLSFRPRKRYARGTVVYTTIALLLSFVLTAMSAGAALMGSLPGMTPYSVTPYTFRNTPGYQGKLGLEVNLPFNPGIPIPGQVSGWNVSLADEAADEWEVVDIICYEVEYDEHGRVAAYEKITNPKPIRAEDRDGRKGPVEQLMWESPDPFKHYVLTFRLYQKEADGLTRDRLASMIKDGESIILIKVPEAE